MGVNYNKIMQQLKKSQSQHHQDQNLQFYQQLNQIFLIQCELSRFQDILIHKIKIANLLSQTHVDQWNKMDGQVRLLIKLFTKYAKKIINQLNEKEFINLETKKNLRRKAIKLHDKIIQFRTFILKVITALTYPLRYLSKNGKMIEKKREKAVYFDKDLNLQDDAWEERGQDKQKQRENKNE